MARGIIAHELKDWSQITSTSTIWDELDLSAPDRNFGIHRYNDRLWTSGYVGVGRLFNKKQKPIYTDGKENIVVIMPQYDVDPWKMLEVVLSDDEYDDYLAELPENEFLFKVFYEQPLIRLAQDARNDGDLLYAISYINACYSLCKKGLKKDLVRQEGNYQSKVRGKINVKRNIRENTARGRNDRFYCQYIDFTEDTLENRILKATLVKAKTILDSRFEFSAEIARKIHFCLNAFRRVKNIVVKNSDFNMVVASGLYMYYKPLMQQARCIVGQKYHSFAAETGQTITQSIYTIPYMINMERLFEFYARAMLKKALADSDYYIDRYSKRIFLQQGVSTVEEAEPRIHLIPYCIPDILICERTSHKPVFVIDAKYKSHSRSARNDTHQLLSYALLTSVDRCGFIFPGTVSDVKTMRSGSDHVLISNGKLKYYELILGDDYSLNDIQKLLRS